MAYATTSSYDKMTLAVDFADTDTFETICGITSWSYTENTNLDETEVPDCADLTKPLQVERAVRSVGATANASGVWSLSSHEDILSWSRSGATKEVKITFGVVTDSGTGGTDTETLTGNAYMTNLSYELAYGQKVQASFDLVFDGLPTVGTLAV